MSFCVQNTDTVLYGSTNIFVRNTDYLLELQFTKLSFAPGFSDPYPYFT
jgi:hypothetical protein